MSDAEMQKAKDLTRIPADRYAPADFFVMFYHIIFRGF